jgi:hypothetical protein
VVAGVVVDCVGCVAAVVGVLVAAVVVVAPVERADDLATAVRFFVTVVFFAAVLVAAFAGVDEGAADEERTT